METDGESTVGTPLARTYPKTRGSRFTATGTHGRMSNENTPTQFQIKYFITTSIQGPAKREAMVVPGDSEALSGLALVAGRRSCA
jgi:hypothetical protein